MYINWAIKLRNYRTNGLSLLDYRTNGV